MARTVVRAQALYAHADPYIADAHNSRKGCIIQSFEDGTDVGSEVKLPMYVIIDTPGIALSAIKQYEQGFRRAISYSIVASDPVQDSFRVDLSVTNKTVSGKGAIIRAQVENYLKEWGAIVVSVNATRVRFDVKIYDAATSPKMWEGAPVVFSEDGYDQTTGIHTIRATYNNAPVPQLVMTIAERIVADHGGILISNDPGSIVFTMDRQTVFDAFKVDIQSKMETRFLKRRYRFDDATVDAAIANRGTLSMTGAQALAAIIDKATE